MQGEERDAHRGCARTTTHRCLTSHEWWFPMTIQFCLMQASCTTVNSGNWALDFDAQDIICRLLILECRSRLRSF